MSFFDTSVNLSNRQFEDDYLDVLEQSHQKGVGGFLIMGTDLRRSNQAADLVRSQKEKYPVYSTAGIQAHQAKTFNKARDVNRLRIALGRERVLALGECGLDFQRNFSTKEEQLVCLEEQIKVAVNVKKPLIIRDRDGFKEVTDLLTKYERELSEAGVKVLITCFDGTAAQAEEYLKLGTYFSFTGQLCDRRRNEALVKALEVVPMDRILLATDCPFMTPYRASDRRNVPMNIGFVAQKVAEVKKLSLEDVSRITRENTQSFFGLASLDEPAGPWVPPPPLARREGGGRFDRREGGGHFDRREGGGRFDRREGGGFRRNDRGRDRFSRGRRSATPVVRQPPPNFDSNKEFPPLPQPSNASYYRDHEPRPVAASGSFLNWKGLTESLKMGPVESTEETAPVEEMVPVTLAVPRTLDESDDDAY